MGIAFVAPWVPYFASTNAIASVNSPIWSAVIEVHYCLVMPFLLLLGRLSKAVVAGLIAVWIVGILLLLASVVWSGGPEIFPSIYGNHFYNVGFFFAGMALALFEKPAFVRRTPWSLVVAISMTALVATQYITSWSLNLALAILPLLFLPVWSLLVARADDTIQATVPVTFRQLRVGFNPLRWLELIGAMSYSVYLMHKPLSLILIDQLGVDRLITGYASLFGVFLGGLAVLLPVIAVIYVVVEARFRRRGAGDDLNRLLRGSIASHEISQRVIGHLPVWLATFCKQKTR